MRAFRIVVADDDLSVTRGVLEALRRGERAVDERRRLHAVTLRDQTGERDRVAVADQLFEVREVRGADVRVHLVAAHEQAR
jgi:hypothetical protein